MILLEWGALPDKEEVLASLLIARLLKRSRLIKEEDHRNSNLESLCQFFESNLGATEAFDDEACGVVGEMNGFG